MSPACCSFCAHPAADGPSYCPKCGAEVPADAGAALVLRQLRAVRVMLRNRVVPPLAARLRAAAALLAEHPDAAPRCADSLGWTGRDAFRLLDEEPNLPLAVPVAERVAALLPPGVCPELRGHVADHRRVLDALLKAEAEWKAGPPSDRKARAWFAELATGLGFDQAGLKACVYASPARWPTVARVLDPDAFAAARPFLLVAAGEAQLAEKNYGLARAKFEAARACDPAPPAAADGLARCALAMNDPAAAVGHSRDAIRLGSADPFTFNRLAWHLCVAGEPTADDVAEAAAAAGRAVELAPAVGAFWDTLAEALERAGDLRGAAAATRESLRWEPTRDAYRARMDRVCGWDTSPAAAGTWGDGGESEAPEPTDELVEEIPFEEAQEPVEPAAPPESESGFVFSLDDEDDPHGPPPRP